MWQVSSNSGRQTTPCRTSRPGSRFLPVRNIVPSEGTPVGHVSTQQELVTDGPVAKHAGMAGRVRARGLSHLATSQRPNLDELAGSDSMMSATTISSNAAVPSAVEAVSHIAVNTGDL